MFGKKRKHKEMMEDFKILGICKDNIEILKEAIASGRELTIEELVEIRDEIMRHRINSMNCMQIHIEEDKE